MSRTDEMLTAVADNPDLIETLETTGVDADTAACLVPAVVGLLELGIGVAAQARAGTGPDLARYLQRLAGTNTSQLIDEISGAGH
jgi:hypothetical protein